MKKSLPSRLLMLRGSDTQAVFAKKIGVLQQTYSRWEQGIRRPSIDEFADLVVQFGVSADWLLGLTDDPTPASKRMQPSSVSVAGNVAGNGIAVGNNNQIHNHTVEARLEELEKAVKILQKKAGK